MRAVRYTLLFSAAFACTHAFAQQVRIEHAPQPEPAPDLTTESAMRVYIDPETGERTSTPTPAQRAALAADPALRQLDAHAVFVEERMPNGAIALTRPGGFMSVMTAQARPEGGVDILCNDATHAHAPGAQHAAPAPTVREER